MRSKMVLCLWFQRWIQSVMFCASSLLIILPLSGQRVGIGTSTPVSTLNLLGPGSNPTIPDSASTGIFRIGVSNLEGVDMGKMAVPPFTGWIQSGYGGIAPDPLSLQPVGGNVGIGTTNPSNTAALEIKSTTRGFLPPRLTFAQRNNISNPETGLVLYCKDCSWNGQLQVYNGGYWESMMGTPGDDLPTVGDPGPEGIIFYIFQPGDPGYVSGETHGLSAGAVYPGFIWGCSGLDIPGADGTALGTGLQNCIDIINECNDPVYAANFCYQDGNRWLPSKDELILLKNSGVGGFIYSECDPPNFDFCQLWTSSEINADSVWVLDILTNNMVAGAKDNYDGSVTPIWSF